jgi:hypothetical protein
MKPYQERVVKEKAELDANLARLRLFFTASVFDTLPPEEKQRLLRQENIMHEYSQVLEERIAAFGKP